MVRNQTPGLLRRHAAWLLVSAAYLFASPYFEQLNNPNENVRVWATRAVAAHGVLEIDGVVREWGYVNDKAKNERHVYSSKAPGVSALGVPILVAEMKVDRWLGRPAPGKRAITFWLRLFAVKLPMCAFLWAFARYAERATGSAFGRDLAVVALGLGTMLYPYGGMFVGHALAAAAAFGAFMLIDDPPEGRPPRLAAAGLLAGAAVVLEYQVLLVALALGVAALVWHRRRALWFIAGAVPPAIALGAYHQALFGKPWAFPYANIENPVFAQTAHAAGFHGLSWPQPGAFPVFLLSPAYGLFAFSPVLLPGLAGAVWLAWRGPARRVGYLVLAIAASMFLFLAGMSNWRAGWCVGPRYIAAVVPFLYLPILRLWAPIARRRWATAGLVALTIVSVVLNVVSGAVYPHYPEALRNPVFQLAFPLVGQGYTPYGAGWALGLRGVVALFPIITVVAGALALIAGGGDAADGRRRLIHTGVATGLAAAFLVALGQYGRTPTAAEAHAQATVRALWDPRGGIPNAHPPL
ncbi:MAG TPA: hypothetical protein VHO67_05300 [Polyangia bacterium]|nr:hypothetical protein [Polyangia bacterium]